MPQRNTPEYRAARFDYIVDGDRSGLDAYNIAVANAIQNRLNRESTMELAKLNKAQADEEGMDQWQKDYSFAKNAKRAATDTKIALQGNLAQDYYGAMDAAQADRLRAQQDKIATGATYSTAMAGLY